jgi:hypothetical protein
MKLTNVTTKKEPVLLANLPANRYFIFIGSPNIPYFKTGIGIVSYIIRLDYREILESSVYDKNQVKEIEIHEIIFGESSKG